MNNLITTTDKDKISWFMAMINDEFTIKKEYKLLKIILEENIIIKYSLDNSEFKTVSQDKIQDVKAFIDTFLDS